MKNFESIENKNNLRQLFKAKREEFCAQSKDPSHGLAGNLIAENLLKVLPKKSNKYWATYRAFKSEANPAAVSLKVDISWCYPVVDGEVLSFYSNENQKWSLNQYQIEEPSQEVIRQTKRIELSDIEGILLPGIAFDLKGQRLGSGKAFYDKTLKNYSGIKVGVAYSVQITESLPSSEHDIPVDVIVTEKDIFTINESKMSGVKTQERKVL
ncbi:MAG: 5-formyltetrahydrofolate cyclo-ligase [Bdellovibrionota bacterium]